MGGVSVKEFSANLYKSIQEGKDNILPDNCREQDEDELRRQLKRLDVNAEELSADILDEKVKSTIEAMDEKALLTYCKKLGLELEPWPEKLHTTKKQENLRLLVRELIRSDFWRHYHEQHGNAKRVKAWLGFHQKNLRAPLETMEKHFAGLNGPNANEALAAATKAFGKYTGRTLKNHSEFEDEQLFKYFLDNCTDWKADLERLHEQHSKEIELNTTLTQQLKKFQGKQKANEEKTDPAQEILSLFQEYSRFILQHLLEEERILVPLWINLSPDEFIQYRTYIRGAYRMVYA